MKYDYERDQIRIRKVPNTNGNGTKYLMGKRKVPNTKYTKSEIRKVPNTKIRTKKVPHAIYEQKKVPHPKYNTNRHYCYFPLLSQRLIDPDNEACVGSQRVFLRQARGALQACALPTGVPSKDPRQTVDSETM